QHESKETSIEPNRASRAVPGTAPLETSIDSATFIVDSVGDPALAPSNLPISIPSSSFRLSSNLSGRRLSTNSNSSDEIVFKGRANVRSIDDGARSFAAESTHDQLKVQDQANIETTVEKSHKSE